MHHVVKITHDEDGTKVDSPKWCLVMDMDGSNRTLCSGQVFGPGEGNAKYQDKVVDKKGITCPDCLDIIKEIKSITL